MDRTPVRRTGTQFCQPSVRKQGERNSFGSRTQCTTQFRIQTYNLTSTNATPPITELLRASTMAFDIHVHPGLDLFLYCPQEGQT